MRQACREAAARGCLHLTLGTVETRPATAWSASCRWPGCVDHAAAVPPRAVPARTLCGPRAVKPGIAHALATNYGSLGGLMDMLLDPGRQERGDDGPVRLPVAAPAGVRHDPQRTNEGGPHCACLHPPAPAGATGRRSRRLPACGTWAPQRHAGWAPSPRASCCSCCAAGTQTCAFGRRRMARRPTRPEGSWLA